MDPSASSKRAFGPDLIRAFAVTCVLLSHTFPGGTTFPIVQVVRGTLGMLGVEIFFVLSGYLIGGILLHQLKAGEIHSMRGVFDFWKRRWFRTLPNYYLFLILNVVLALWMKPHLLLDWWKFLWFGQGLLESHPLFFTEAWSLAVEEWFYLLFPFCIWALIKIFKNSALAFWVSVALFLIVPTILRSVPWSADWDNGVRKVTFLRLDAIMFGVVLSYIQLTPKHWMKLRKLWPVGAIGVVALCGTSQILNDSHFVFSRVLFFTLLSLSISLVLPFVAGLSEPRAFINRPIRKISLWSYSMYLSHGPLIKIFGACFVAAGWSVHGINAVCISLLVWVATLGVSALIYSRYEKPLMDLRDRSSRAHTGEINPKG